MPWLLLVLVAGPDWEARVEQGRLLIRELREEEALKVLEPLAARSELGEPLRARALIYVGIAWCHLGRDDLARQRFEAALLVDHGAALPDWVSRRVRWLFDEVVRAHAPAPAGVEPPPPSEANPEGVPMQPRLTPSEPLRPPSGDPAVAASTAGEAAGVTGRDLTWARVLGGIALAAVVGAGVCFGAWAAQFQRANAEPESLDARRISAGAAGWFYGGEVAAAVAVASGIGAVFAWRLAPTPGGAAVTVSGKF